MSSKPPKGFDFDSTGIAGIFKAARLHVPLYQREYSWEKEQVTQLLTDLARAKSVNTDHFLGTIVTIAKESNKPLEIVDGQQRLTTTSLLITAIRDAQKQLGVEPQPLLSISDDYLAKFDRRAGGLVPRLTLNIDDNEFYKSIIGGTPIAATRESHDRLSEAYKECRSFVSRIIATSADRDKVPLLNEWLEFVEFDAQVILVKTDNASRAFKMFETLNDRGLKTSQADLVKSYLFGESGDRILEAQARWSSMKDNLEQISDDDRAINFLRHTVIATTAFVRAEEIYDKIQSTVRGESSAAAFLSSLETYSRVYVATFQPSADHWRTYPAATAKALETFNRFDLRPIRPLLFSLALKFSPVEFQKALHLLVTISVRLVVASRTRSGTLETTFATAALGVFKDTINTTKSLRESLGTVAISDVDFHAEFKVARVSNAGNARYYLRALEAANANESEPWYIANDDPAVMTLEHVMPQNPSAEWEGLDAEKHRQLYKRLGNLCLMNKGGNEASANDAFAIKRPILGAAPYSITNMIARQEVWDQKAIEERQDFLAGLAVKAWSL